MDSLLLKITPCISRSKRLSVTGSVRCTEGMFALLTGRTLRAPLSYFETTPLGRIINRFTYDVEVLDVELAVAMLGLMISASWLVSSVVVMVRRIVMASDNLCCWISYITGSQQRYCRLLYFRGALWH